HTSFSSDWCSDVCSSDLISGNRTVMECRLNEFSPGVRSIGAVSIGVHGNSTLQAGQTANGQLSVSLSGNFQSAPPQTSVSVRVRGPERAPSVKEVSGIVTDQATGEPIQGARVYLVDRQGTALE